jgi:hypothetical protein
MQQAEDAQYAANLEFIKQAREREAAEPTAANEPDGGPKIDFTNLPPPLTNGCRPSASFTARRQISSTPRPYRSPIR